MPIKLLTVDKNGFLLEPTPLEIIRKMRREYEQEIHRHTTARLRRRRPELPGIRDTLSVWVSRKEVEALLEDNKANGMRIYFGAHYERRGDLNPELEYYGRHNLILVATIDSTNPDEPTTENSVDQLRESPDPSTANSVITSGEFEGFGADQLPLCPPRCP